jgi:hypothetical protein
MPAEVVVGDPQRFMDMLVRRTVEILETEPIDVWVNPAFLPASLQPEFATLWTAERRQRVIDAAVRRQVAIEINDLQGSYAPRSLAP